MGGQQYLWNAIRYQDKILQAVRRISKGGVIQVLSMYLIRLGRNEIKGQIIEKKILRTSAMDANNSNELLSNVYVIP